MKLIPETRRVHLIRYLLFYCLTSVTCCCRITGVKLVIVTIVTTIPRWRREKPARSILLIISLCVVYLRMVCW